MANTIRKTTLAGRFKNAVAAFKGGSVGNLYLEAKLIERYGGN